MSNSKENKYSEFPIHKACSEGNLYFLENLLSSRELKQHLKIADDKYSWSPIHLAAYSGNIECIKLLLQHDPGIVDYTCSKYRQTALHIATFCKNNRCASLLLESGANVNMQDYLGETSLHKAVRVNSENGVKLLIQNGAILECKNCKGSTATDLAFECRNQKLGNFMKQFKGVSPMFKCPQKDIPPVFTSTTFIPSSNGYYGCPALPYGVNQGPPRFPTPANFASANENPQFFESNTEHPMEIEEITNATLPSHTWVANGYQNRQEDSTQCQCLSLSPAKNNALGTNSDLKGIKRQMVDPSSEMDIHFKKVKMAGGIT